MPQTMEFRVTVELSAEPGEADEQTVVEHLEGAIEAAVDLITPHANGRYYNIDSVNCSVQ